MRVVIDRAKEDPKRIVFPEGEDEKILRAAKILVDQGIAHPILLARARASRRQARRAELAEDRITIVHPEKLAAIRALYAAVPTSSGGARASPSRTASSGCGRATTSAA